MLPQLFRSERTPEVDPGQGSGRLPGRMHHFIPWGRRRQLLPWCGIQLAAEGCSVGLLPSAHALAAVADGSSPFAKVLKEAKNPALLIGQGALQGADKATVAALTKQIAADAGVVAEGWNGYCVLQHTGSAAGAPAGSPEGGAVLLGSGMRDAGARPVGPLVPSIMGNLLWT